MRHGGDLVVETLRALGTTTVFGVPGQHALALFDGLTRSDLRFISSRVENNAAFAADGYARATGEPAALLLSAGPGALTALAGLQEAYATGVPMIVVAGQIPQAGLGGRRKGMLHALDDQQASAVNVTKAQHTVFTTSAIPAVLEAAWRTAMTAPQGPVWVEIPQDVLLAPAAVPAPTRIQVDVPQLAPRPEAINEAAEVLAGAVRPVIVAGGGVRRAGGAAQLKTLAEHLHAPVVCTPGGNSVFPHDHPLSLGSWVEDADITEVLADADVLLALGTSLGEVTSNYYTLRPGGRLIHVDAEPRVVEANHPGLGIVADARLAIEDLHARLSEHSARPARRWGPQPPAQLVAEVRDRISRRLASQELTHELQLMAAIRNGIPDDALSFWDMTIAGYWAWNMWDARAGQLHSAQGAGGLGFGFPGALGGAVGAGQRVLAVSGDGSAMYSIAELAAAKQHATPVTWLIIDDGGYGILREYMRDTFSQTIATELTRPDFVALAESFAIPAVRTDAANLEDTLIKAWSQQTGPNVVVVETVMHMWEPTHRKMPPAQ